MNAQNALQFLPLVQALADGKLQELRRGTAPPSWGDITWDVEFTRDPECYRRKPEPREIWLNEYPDHVMSVAHESKSAAENNAGRHRASCTHFREVIDP